MMELMRKSEKAAEERLDMVITELRRYMLSSLCPHSSLFFFSFYYFYYFRYFFAFTPHRSKGYAESLQNRVTGNQLYHYRFGAHYIQCRL